MKTQSRIAIGAIAVMAMMMLSPIAMAQTVTVDSAKTKDQVPPLLPEIETAQVTLAYKYDFGNPVTPVGGASQTTATATIQIKCTDPNIIVTGPESTTFNISPTENSGASSTFEYESKFTIAVTRDLPGLKQIRCNTESFVDAIQGGGTAPIADKSNTAPGAFTVSAKFYSVVQAKVAQQIKQAGPQKDVPFEVQLDNFGNARTQINFEINERPGGDKWSAVVPDDVILDSPASGGAKTSDTAVFTVTTPFKNGWNNEQGTYRLKMKTFAADDPTQEGVELFTNVLVRVRGVYVPSLEPFVMVGAVIGSALIARQKLQ